MANAHDGGKSVEQRTADLFQKSDGAILWEADASAVHFLFVSESANAVLGFSPQQWQAERGFLQKHVHPEDWSRLLGTLYEAAADGTLHKCEHRMLKADGSTLWAQTSVRPSDSPTGVTVLSGVTVDVTHVKEIEDRVHREEARARRLIENLRGCAVFLMSSKGVVETWTEEARRMTGYASSEMIGERIARLFALEERDGKAPERVLRSAEAQHHASFEGWFARADGATFWGTLSITATIDGAAAEPPYAVVLTDLTARHELEQGLRRTAEDLRLLVQNVHEEGIWMTSREGLVESWNRGAQRLAGYRPHEIIGTSVAALLPATELRKGTLDRLLKEAARTGIALHEGWLVRNCGTPFWGCLCFAAAEDESEHLRGFATIVRDLTEQKRREDTLRANEEHFRLLVDSVQDYAIFMLSVEGLVVSWNRGAQRLNGYRSQEILGSHVSRFFGAEEIENGAPAHLIERAAADGHASYEGWLVRRKGERFWGMIQLDCIEDENGQLRGFSNVARDLSAQQATEAALRESEERLRLLIDSVQDYAVFMIAPDGTVATWSRTAERLEGLTAEDAIGAPLARFFPTEIASTTVDRLLEQARTAGSGEYEGWFLRHDGSRFWGNLTVSAVRDAQGQLRGFSNICRDLTERMRAERAQTFLADAGQVLAGSLEYRATLKKLAQLATPILADCCIVALDGAGPVRVAAVAHVDADKQRTLEGALDELAKDSPLLRGLVQTMKTGESLLHADVTGAEWFHDELDAVGPWGVRHLGVRSCICVPMIARGQAFGAIAYLSRARERPYDARDVSLAEELTRRGALAVENARLFEEAQRAIRTREEVLAIVSHDLRAPLSTIMLGARQFVKDAPLEAPVASTLARIARTAERMTHMIGDLLDFSSIEAGRLTLEMQECNARELVLDVIDMHAPIAREKGVRLVDEATRLDLRLRCDPTRIVQVLSNLVGNGIKFTPAGKAVTVSTEVAAGGRAITFHVVDSGPGISPEDLPHIFERYWQARRRAGGGVGLGLAISKGIIEAHGGTIAVATKPSHGCTFSFTLPVS